VETTPSLAMRGLAKLDWDFLLLFFLVLQQCKIQDPSFLDCMTSSKLYRNRKQNFQVLKPNVNCVTLAAGCSTPQVYNVNWVVPPAGYIPQKWGGHVPPSSYGGAAHAPLDSPVMPSGISFRPTAVAAYKHAGCMSVTDDIQNTLR